MHAVRIVGWGESDGVNTTMAMRHQEYKSLSPAPNPPEAATAAPESAQPEASEGLYSKTDVITMLAIAVVLAVGITALVCLGLYLQFGRVRTVAVNFDAKETTPTAKPDSESTEPSNAGVAGNTGHASMESTAQEEPSPASAEPVQEASNEARDRASSVAIIDI